MPAFLSCLSHDLGGWGIAALGNLVDIALRREMLCNITTHFCLVQRAFFWGGGGVDGVIVSAVVFNQVCVLAKTYRMSKEV